MVEAENITHIVPLTYGVMPRTKYSLNPETSFRLAGDSALTANAAEEAFNTMTASGHELEIFIPGATFFGGEVDAEYMKNHISNSKRTKSVPVGKIEATGICSNTPTQMAEIQRRQYTGQMGEVLIICASWQIDDAASLMHAYKVKGRLVTDQAILRSKYKAFFAHQAGYATHSKITETFKRKADTAKQLAWLNKHDKKGKIRTLILTRFLGQGISDWEFRGLERDAHETVLRREAQIAAKRELKSHS